MVCLSTHIIALITMAKFHPAPSLSTVVGSVSKRPICKKMYFCSTMSLQNSPSNSDVALNKSGHTSQLASLYGKTLVSVSECIEAYQMQQEQHSNTNLRITFIDASWYHRPDPKSNVMRNPIYEFQTGPRIPNAHYLDIDSLATSYELFPSQNPLNLPHMMPPSDLFGKAMDAYGICNEDHIVIYAKRGAVFTPRTWFLFVAMGHPLSKVHLMQGSLEDWIEAGGDVETHSMIESGFTRVSGKKYDDCFFGGILNITALYHSKNKVDASYEVRRSKASNICSKEEVLQAVNAHIKNQQSETNDSKTQEDTSQSIIIDTRGSGYTQKGHMPSAIHLPYRILLNPLNPLQLLPKSELHTIFSDRGIKYDDPNLKIILSCGSGVSVCHGFLALLLLGREISEENTRIYDGSWKEWGRLDEDLPRILPDEITR